MNILVTGGAGFIGSHVADALLKAGHDVVVVDNLRTGHRRNVPAAARYYEADIRNQEEMARIFDQEGIEAVVHQAARANVRESMEQPLEYAEVNVLGTLGLLELAAKRGCRKFVFASTGGATYGEGAGTGLLPFTEKSWPRPRDNYGANKLSAEHHVELYYANYGLPYAILRYANIYGPRQDSKGEAGVVAIFAGAMLAGEPTRITGDGTQTRDFTYVSDVARANLAAVEQDAVGLFNIGTGAPTDVKTVHSLLAQLTDYRLAAEHVARPASEVLSTYLDASKARNELNWQAEVGLQEGLEQVVAWMRGD